MFGSEPNRRRQKAWLITAHRRRARLVVVFREHPAERRRHAEHVEVVAVTPRPDARSASLLTTTLNGADRERCRSDRSASGSLCAAPGTTAYRKRRAHVPAVERLRGAVVARVADHVVVAGPLELHQRLRDAARATVCSSSPLTAREQRRVRADAQRQREQHDGRPAPWSERACEPRGSGPEASETVLYTTRRMHQTLSGAAAVGRKTGKLLTVGPSASGPWALRDVVSLLPSTDRTDAGQARR